MKKLVYLFVLLMTVACNSDDSKSVEFLTLSSNQITTAPEGASQAITVNSSSDWTIDESSIPAWCTITEQTTAGFTITVLPNHTFIDREGKILTKNGATTNSITITQEGIENSPSLDWHTFPVNNFSDIQDANLKRMIKGRTLFITSSVRSQIYHANLIKNSFVLGEDIKAEGNYTFNPITFSAHVSGELYIKESVTPSKEVSDAMYEEIIANTPTQSDQLSISSPYQFNSYKHLHLLGVGNLGLKLDELVTGNSYMNQEMGDRTGLLYTYSNVMFHSIMDLSQKLITEDLPDAEADKLAYINSIGYGRTALLIVESDYDYTLSKSVVSKIAKGESLTDEEKQVEASLTATYLYFDKDGAVRSSTGYQSIAAYNEGFSTQPIIPLNFSVSNYKDDAVGDLEFSFPMP